MGLVTQLPGHAYFIFVGECQGFPWYRLDKDGNKLAVQAQGLQGVIERIRISVREGRTPKDAEVYKLDLFLNDAEGDRYCLRSGIGTWFSRGLVAALVQLDGEDLQQPVTIAPRLGDEGNVIFANCFITGHKIRIEGNHGEIDVLTSINQINQELGVETEVRRPQSLEAKQGWDIKKKGDESLETWGEEEPTSEEEIEAAVNEFTKRPYSQNPAKKQAKNTKQQRSKSEIKASTPEASKKLAEQFGSKSKTNEASSKGKGSEIKSEYAECPNDKDIPEDIPY